MYQINDRAKTRSRDIENEIIIKSKCVHTGSI